MGGLGWWRKLVPDPQVILAVSGGGGIVLLYRNTDITTHRVVCVRLGIRWAEEEAGQLKQLL